MTNAQKWVTAFLGIFIVLFFIGRFTKEEVDYSEEHNSYESQEPVQLDGLALINKIGCVSCHGSDLKGTGLAPGLYSAKEYWSREKLIGYLRNPSSYNGDDRFEAYKTQYKSLMPSYSNIDVDQLGIIADYLLSLENK
ncbi:MAG: cytochrome c [Bacteroidetes bacterium]|nr:cytochrome c [Bacteroidota bacterium]